MVIYRTNEWKGYGKQNYYWNEYRLEGNTIYQRKSFASESIPRNTGNH